jgi:hypothetical protein
MIDAFEGQGMKAIGFVMLSREKTNVQSTGSDVAFFTKDPVGAKKKLPHGLQQIRRKKLLTDSSKNILWANGSSGVGTWNGSSLDAVAADAVGIATESRESSIKMGV